MSFLTRTARSIKQLTAFLSIKLNTLKTKFYLRVKGIQVSCKNVSFEGSVKLEIENSATVVFAEGVKLSNCFIEAGENSKILIGEGCTIQGMHIKSINGSTIQFQKNVLIERKEPYISAFTVDNGKLEIGQDSRIRCSIKVQQGGELKIGKRSFVNQGSEIRCDNAITIGDYTIISYEVNIFDTNTHSTDWQERHDAIATSPLHRHIGEPRPATKPIVIGNDCWIGKRAAILKGVTIGNQSIVAFGAILTISIPEKSVAYGNPAQWKKIQAPKPEITHEV